MEDVIDPFDGFIAVVQIADVAFDKVEAGPLVCRDFPLDFIQVVLVSGGEVVQADNGLILAQQGFEQVGANKPRHAGDEPGFGVGFEILLYLFVAGCHGDACLVWWSQSSCELLATSFEENQNQGFTLFAMQA